MLQRFEAIDLPFGLDVAAKAVRLCFHGMDVSPQNACETHHCGNSMSHKIPVKRMANPRILWNGSEPRFTASTLLAFNNE
jgi:hypothetical protein